MIKHLLKSSEFLIRMKAGQHRSSRHKRHIRLSNGKRIPLNIYIPKHTRPCGTVVFMHGMNHQGHLDKRVINLCHTLADCGYQVVSPHFDDIAHYWIDPKQIDDISLTLEAIASEPILAHNGKITVFSISFTGTLALAASGREVCRDALWKASCFWVRFIKPGIFSNTCSPMTARKPTPK